MLSKATGVLTSYFSCACPGLIWISSMRNMENNSHVNQLALLINMAKDEQDHVNPAAAIFVLWAWTRFTLICQCYFKTPSNSSISKFKHSCRDYNNSCNMSCNRELVLTDNLTFCMSDIITFTECKETGKKTKNNSINNQTEAVLTKTLGGE